MNDRKSETLRGLRESRSAIETLRSLWPAAFPRKFGLVRPLESGVIREISERTGWTASYTRGVLRGWKRRGAYCEAVLREDYRVNLKGELVGQTVDEQARAAARGQLAKIAGRLAKEQEKQQMCARSIPAD